MKDDSDLELRKYLWRAAAICRRHGFTHSAVIIADDIEALTNAMIKRPDVNRLAMRGVPHLPGPNTQGLLSEPPFNGRASGSRPHNGVAPS